MTGDLSMNKHWIDHLDSAGYGVWNWNIPSDRLHYSKRWKSMLGYAVDDEIKDTFSEFQDRIHPEDLPKFLVSFNEHLAGTTPVFMHEFRMLAKNQSYRWIMSQASVFKRDASGRALAMSGTHEDITKSKESLHTLVEKNTFMDRVVNSAPLLVYIFDLETHQNIYCNNAVFNVLGYTVGEIQSQDGNLIDSSLFHLDDLDKLQAHFKALTKMADGEIREIDYRVRNKDGDYLIIRSHDVVFKRNQQNQVTQVLGTGVDITKFKDSEFKLDFLSNYDPLTGLMNRTLLHTRLEQAMSISKSQGTLLAVCFIDLDDFKFINNRHGHHIGDRVLIEVASRLQKRMRENDSLSRVGGDEFILVIQGLISEEHALKVIDGLMSLFSEPVEIKQASIDVSISMGVSFYPQHGLTIDRLSRNADTAMYRAKETGKNTFKIYCESMSRDLVGRLQLEDDLKEAVIKQQFELYYQPKINLINSRVVGLEALIRWNHPTKGVVSPDQFIPVAEQLGCIIEIGEWVLKQACLDLIKLQDQASFYGTIAVNVSGVQLEKGDFAITAEKIMKQTGVNPKEIEFEITESAIMNNPVRWVSLLSELRALGFKISIDDFGTGYSSLNYLKKLPVNKLKIDKTFIDDLTFDEDDHVIVSAIVSLTDAMNMVCLAEGIETESQLNKLIEIGCEQGQGYLFSKPLPLSQIVVWLLDLSSVQNQVVT